MKIQQCPVCFLLCPKVSSPSGGGTKAAKTKPDNTNENTEKEEV